MKRTLYTCAFVLAATIAASAVLGVVGCSKSSTDSVGNQSQQLIEAGTISTIASFGFSPSATVSGTTIVVGFHDVAIGTSPTTSSAGYARSTDGVSWTRCNMIDTGTFFAGCNGGPAPLASTQTHWATSVPSVVADGREDVVYVSLGTTATDDANHTPPSLVVATLSTNSGSTFQWTTMVNEPGGDCDGGIQDLPNAAFDFTTEPPTLWVVWRHKTGSSFGGCVRRGHVVTGDGGTKTIRWLDVARSVGGMDKENNADSFMGQGGMRIQAGDGIVAVAYSNNDEISLCPNLGTTSIRWGMVTSYDNAANWTTRSSILHTNNFQGCTMNGRIQNSLRAFDFQRTPDGNYYVAINDTKGSVRLFHSPASGVRVSSGNDNLAWRELCPSTSTFDGGTLDAGTPPVASWTAPGGACGTVIFSSTGSEFFPGLGADGNDRVGLTFFNTSDDVTLRTTFFGNIGPRTVTATWQVRTLGSTMKPNPDAAANLSGVLGETICTLGRSAQSAEGCTGEGSFFPFWPFVQVRQTFPSLTTQQLDLH